MTPDRYGFLVGRLKAARIEIQTLLVENAKLREEIVRLRKQKSFWFYLWKLLVPENRI